MDVPGWILDAEALVFAARILLVPVAIYHLSVRSVSRAKAKRGDLKRDYIKREGRYLKDKDEILYKESGNLPAWAPDDKTFWRSADLHERRNARIGIEVEVALPKELNDEAKIILARRLRAEVVKEKFPYTMAVHRGVKTEGGNPHLHLMFSARTLDNVARSEEQFFRRANTRQPEQGGAPKDRGVTKKMWLADLRQSWAALANDQLEREGREVRIDHRSLEAQGKDRIPREHIGPNVLKMEGRGVKTERGAQVVETHLQAGRYAALQQDLAEVQHAVRQLERDRGLERD